MTMASDSYALQLDEMIQLFQEYKSGSVTLDNITKLCQTLGLESFIDDIDAETSRLSTASKIIVIDIDFSKSIGRVKDVKLVLASNFDNFNYFNEPVVQANNDSNSNEGSNILLNSLTQYPDLHQFHHNLKFLYLLDTFSSINIDANNNGGPNNDGGGGEFSGELDLFKYFTELAQFLRQYFADQGAPLKVVTNLNNRFGIYIMTQLDRVLLAKITFEKSRDSQQRLYEYVYYEGNKEWINESPESFTSGVSMVMEISDKTNPTWFPKDYVPKELVLDEGDSNDKINDVSPNEFMNSLSMNASRGKFQVMNDFTTQLVPLRKFDISNDNSELIIEILRWIQWSRTVLYPIYKTLNAPEDEATKGDAGKEGTVTANGPQGRHGSVAAEHRKRRHSSKNKRSSMTEATMLKEEGLQQFNLQELMTDQDTDLNQGSEKASTGLLGVDKMQVDDQAIDDSDTTCQLVFSEDRVSLENVAQCTLYDDMAKWDSFIEAFKTYSI
ncbi:hypothetical protein ZYGR_0I06950 [Zygosaccharomyces rouxii]|uniref:Mediator of RNA polymerase II transcription subunit 1 n=2 Tax=Zygosaccharomyces rouxii TaxID=4956 RepID=C5DUG0_ZYGRC|nr:uncharacterized protein ZYRO0C16434g [Zygosaccharomyces rouxii]KAH9201408.1 mediator of RNA polymerase II transcription subunit 1-domain-containing protein [Zygosaccharomyces rouxii]GAV48398.1 hypothetical protein ZYGR_0I06950 [Zygosaccharomyces rouxii]CAR27421.1 ZYRO0C16434p [Zygosaccharomyces rouxii]